MTTNTKHAHTPGAHPLESSKSKGGVHPLGLRIADWSRRRREETCAVKVFLAGRSSGLVGNKEHPP